MGLTVDLDKTYHLLRLKRAIPIATYFTVHLKDLADPISREDMEDFAKHLDEYSLKAVKAVFKWICDYRKMRVSFPDKKYKA